MADKRKTLVLPVLIVVISQVWLSATAAKGPKMEASELVERHLASIGSAEARAAVMNRSAWGQGTMSVIIGGTGSLAGPATYFSEGRKSYFSIDFNHNEYPAERFTCSGDKTYVPDIRPGERSAFGFFLYQYDRLIKEGLVGGVLSAGWSLLDLNVRQPKLKYRGLKKLDGQELLELNYRMRKGGGDFKISLYFDPETFRHLATVYKLEYSPFMAATPDATARQNPTRIKFEERFSGFRTVDDLTLPCEWIIRLTGESDRGTQLSEWQMVYEQLLHNQSLEPNQFFVD